MWFNTHFIDLHIAILRISTKLYTFGVQTGQGVDIIFQNSIAQTRQYSLFFILQLGCFYLNLLC